jgi:DNA topoisomerase VI subunit B
MTIELIPSARRLIRSLRDIGYEFVDAVADIVDNSVEAGATVISISLQFDGEDSYLTIADNGLGMASKEIQEALRFGSNRSYDDADDLGRYGLGLKTASLSQCEKLTVSARRGEERARINSYCWDLAHIERTNRWEILKVESDQLKDEARSHLGRTTGTVVTWERLGRLMGYKYPSGEYARKQSDLMVLICTES